MRPMAPSLSRLKCPLRATSGSKVQVIVGMPCAAAHARWCSLRAEPIPLSLLPGRAAAIIE